MGVGEGGVLTRDENSQFAQALRVYFASSAIELPPARNNLRTMVAHQEHVQSHGGCGSVPVDGPRAPADYPMVNRVSFDEPANVPMVGAADAHNPYTMPLSEALHVEETVRRQSTAIGAPAEALVVPQVSPESPNRPLTPRSKRPAKITEFFSGPSMFYDDGLNPLLPRRGEEPTPPLPPALKRRRDGSFAAKVRPPDPHRRLLAMLWGPGALKRRAP